VAAVDGILVTQSKSDARYFASANARTLSVEQLAQVEAGLLRAYRWQYIVSGVQDPRFQKALGSLITPAQAERIGQALAPILAGQNVH
jgi:hypothetical protein